MARGSLPADTTLRLKLKERRLDLAVRFLALAFLLVFLWAASLIWAATALEHRPDWLRYLGLPPTSDPLSLGTACLFNGACRARVLTPLYAQKFGLPYTTTFFLALSPLLASFWLWISARFLNAERLPGAAQFSESIKHLLEGISYLGIKNGKLLRYPGDLRFRHTLIVGSTGAGKTSRIIKPMLAMTAKEGRSAVVFDLKYPDLGLLQSIRLFERYGRKVLVLLPYDPASPRLPLLRGAEDPRVALELAEVIVPVDEQEKVTTFYSNIERQLLATLLNIEARDGEGSLGNIFRLARRGHAELTKYIKSRAPNAEELLGFFFGLSSREQASMVAGLTSKLSIFAHPYLDRATSFGDNELDLSVLGREPTLFYLGIPQLYLMGGVGQLFLQLVKRYLDRRILEEVERQGGSTLRVPIEVYLDEFTNLGYLPYMPDNLSTMRQRGVATIIAVQSFNQALERYPEASWESIMANCNTWVIFGQGLHDQDAKRVSEALGKASYEAKSHGVMAPHLLDWRNPWPRMHDRKDVRAIPLLAPEEIRNIPKAHALIRLSEDHPLIAYFPRPDEALSKKTGIPHEFRALSKDIVEDEADLRRIAESAGSKSEPDMLAAARYVIAPYLTAVPDRETERRAVLERATDPRIELLTWFHETLVLGAEVEVKTAPGTGEITKLSVRPPGGEPPAKAKDWQKARWVKVEKGGRYVSLIPPTLEDFIKEHRDLVQWALLLTRIKHWLKENPARLEDANPPLKTRDDGIVVSAELLAELGFKTNELPPMIRPIRLQNRRGYFLVPTSITHPLIPASGGANE